MGWVKLTWVYSLVAGLRPLELGEIKIEIGNWEEQYKSMKAKFPISIF